MNLINQHIRKHLFHFHNEVDVFFYEIVESIQSESKEKIISLLRYVHLLLNETFSENEQGAKTLHLHFEYDFDDEFLLVIAQYLLIRFFKESSKIKVSASQSSEQFELLKANLKSKTRKLSACPDGASGMNGGNRIYKTWIRDKKQLQELVDFYNLLDNNTEIYTNTIFNCQNHLANSLDKLFKTRPYACGILNKKNYQTFSLCNTKLTLNEIDEIDDSIIDNLETVILFDCERNRTMQHFSLQDLKDYDINLKKHLIFSFGNKHNSLQSLRDKLALIQNRFKISKNISYPILQSEIDFCLNQRTKKYIPVLFIGMDNSDLWDAFILETNIYDLYELRSIKMMNLYSLCFNEEIRDFILRDIFTEKNTFNLISDETEQRILSLTNDDLLALKYSLKNVLDLIISSGIKRAVYEKMKNETVLVIDDFVLNNKKLTLWISSALSLGDRNKLIPWSQLKAIKKENILILSYQDQGRYPNYFFPNVIEANVPKNITIAAVYLKFLFSTRYAWAKYSVAKDLHKLSDHFVRQKHFQWNRLKNSINILHPQKNDDTNWDLEQQYLSNASRETIRLKIICEREKTFNSSELFIYSIDKKSFKVEKIGDILDTIDEDKKYFVHHLDEIQERINLYEKMVDTRQQEEELNIIRQQFPLKDTDSGRLWKILLKQMALNAKEELLYEELKTFLESKGLKIVSFIHFKNNWLSPESESIAPLSKKVFIELCNFLNLPKTYFILIQRLRNASKQSNRQSTRQMNRLLQDLFNDGSFDEGVDINKTVKTNLEKYIRKHPLEELGIDEKYLGDNLVALVELIKAEVTLKELEKFKKIE